MSGLILHHYDASPFTQKALLMLGIKGATWRSVETPMLPPKPDLTALTGGYRGTPVLQIGADIYVDSQRIARELDVRLPEPALLPEALAGLGLMLVKWSDQLFRTALYRAIDQTVEQWDPAFVDDRRYLFPDVDFDRIADEVDHRSAQYRAHLALLEQQLGSGRAYLGGAEPTLLDVQAYPFLWMSAGLAGTEALAAGYPRVAAWQTCMASIGEGQRIAITAETALLEARDATPLALPVSPDRDPVGPPTGTKVSVSPDDTRRGSASGMLLRLTGEDIVIAHEHQRVGRVHVHFPRLGYRVDSA